LTIETENKSKYFDALVPLVAAGESVAAAADGVGCANSTAYRISSTPEFKAAVVQARAAFVREATGKLARACSKAVEILIEIAEKSKDERVQLRAASVIIDRFSKLSDNVELRERIDALEAAADEQ